MKHSAYSLAMRDPALAALMGVGVSDSDFGADFGSDFGGDFGDDLGADEGFVGADEMGDDYGDDFGAQASARGGLTTQQQVKLLAAWKRHRARQAVTAKRARILNPNANSLEKVERYIFPLSQEITFGVPSAISLNDRPDVRIRPQRITTNAPCQMFASLTDVKLANVSVKVGAGSIDAFTFGAQGVGVSLDMPTIEPSQAARVTGNYSGLTPPPFAGGTTTIFNVNLIGPATMAG